MVLAAGCAQLSYYSQAAQGQYALLSNARPIEDWLADPAADDRLKSQLAKAREIRQFAVKELGLPDNGSYRNYTNLRRPFALWNVVATPELSLTPQQWCFPIAGCVTYRGYYNQADAQLYAAQLRAQGDDVQVAGVPAYSTLGWFNDPLLSSYIQYSEGELARLIFHELAHQVVYAQGDTQFNESFATAVEEAGVQHWMDERGTESTRERYMESKGRRRDFSTLLLKHRKALESNYERSVSAADKRAEKIQIFEALQHDYQNLKIQWGGYAGYDRWFAEPLSNAHLASVATYERYVPAFRVMLAKEQGFKPFYAAVKRLAAMDKQERQQRLMRLAAQG